MYVLFVYFDVWPLLWYFIFMKQYSSEQAFQSFLDGLSETIQSPEALANEARYHLDHLTALINSGEWVQDDAGNVYPSSLTDEDRATIRENSRFSIIGSVPTVEGPYSTNFKWRAAGSLISDLTVVVCYPNLTSFELDASESTYLNTTIILDF